MNIGIRLHDTAPGTLEERLDAASAQGFRCAHLALSKVLPGFGMDDAPELLRSEALADRVRTAFARRGMQCAVLGCYLRLANMDGEALRRTQDVYRAHLAFARAIGAGVVGTETPPAAALGMTAAEIQSDEALELFIRCARPVVRAAEEAGAVLGVEPVCNHIVSGPERAERMLDALGSGNVRIILDAVNLLTNATADGAERIVEEAVRRLGDRVCVLHMKDFVDAPGELRPRAVACGEGRMRFEPLLRLARRRELPMTLENTAPENAAAARRYLERVDAEDRRREAEARARTAPRKDG